MNPTVEVVRIQGHGTDHLSLHAKRRQALIALAEVGRLVWRRRFDYNLPADLDAHAVILRLRAEGWTVTVTEQAVEL